MGDCYRFLYNRVYNDIEVEGNYLRTEVSGNTGEVINYYAFWNDLDFKDEKVKSIDEAKNIYKDKLGYDIFYKVKSEDYENNAKLIYKTKYDENAYIDAVTGEIKTNRDFVVAENAKFASLSADTEQSARGAVLSEKELKMIDNIKGFISKFDALTIVKNIEEFEVDDKYVLNSSEIYRKANGKYVINISVSTQNEKKESFYKYFTLDADTGTVIGFNQYASVYIDNENEEFDNNEGKKIAESFLKKYYGKEFESCVFAEKLTVNDGLYEYKKVKDGVKVVNNGFTVRINKATGKIDSFSYTEDDALYESQDNIKGLDDVYGKLLTEDNFKLKYIIIPDGDNKNDVKPFLVYKTEDNPTYDAKTLEKISAYTLEKDDETVKPEYTDIAGHYAENYIKRLLDEDIYLEGNELNPNEPITNKEFASLLYMVFSGSKALPLDVLYKNAVSYFGLDEEFEEEAEITRLDAIKMFIEKMGYKEFAEIEGIFNCPFDDIEEKDKGYVSIAAGLKLISTEDKLFYKDNLLKKCDALIIIYNYMAR